MGYYKYYYDYEVLIDTGVNVDANYYTSASDVYAASATLKGGTSTGGGGTGYSEARVVIGDGLNTGAGGGLIDGRVYILFKYVHRGNGSFTANGIDWKLVRL